MEETAFRKTSSTNFIDGAVGERYQVFSNHLFSLTAARP